MHLQESLQYSPRVLHGQPFAFCPSFLEHTPLHLQLADSAGTDNMRIDRVTQPADGKFHRQTIMGRRANFARDSILASDWSLNNGIDLSCVIACTCAEA